MATLPSPVEVNLPARLLARTGLASQVASAGLRLGEIAFTSDDYRFWIGDETTSPPWVLTSKTTGNIDWTKINPTFNNINVSTINGLTLAQIVANNGGGGGTSNSNTVVSSQVPLGKPLNLNIFNAVSSPSTLVTVTADELVLSSSANLTYRLVNVSISISSASNMDTGTIAASTAYDIYLGYNTTTNAVVGWLTVEGATPAVPFNVVYYRRIGWQRTDANKNFYRIRQTNDEWHYVAQGTTSGVFPTTAPVVASGPISGYQAISLAGIFPVKTIRADFTSEGLALGYNQSCLAPNPNWGSPSSSPSTASLMYSSTQDDSISAVTTIQISVMLEPQTNGLPTVYINQDVNCVVGALGGQINI